MKKSFRRMFITVFVITAIFSFNVGLNSVSAVISAMTIPQLIELLITIGVIAPDKALAARAAIASFTQATTSPTNFASAVPYLQVLSPNGAETWEMQISVPYVITWGSSNNTPVDVFLVPAKGAACKLNSSPVVSVNDNNTFKVLLKTARCYGSNSSTSTPLADGSYKARVSYVGSSALVKDDSDSFFKITPVPVPSIKITVPNGGERLSVSSNYDIKYTLKNITERSMRLFIYDNQGNSVYSISGLNGTKGVYRFHIPSSLSSGPYKFKLQITAGNGTILEDTSDNYFWISNNL